MIFTRRNPDTCESMSNTVSNLEQEVKKRQEGDGRQDLRLKSLVKKRLMDLVALINIFSVFLILVKLLTDFQEGGFLKPYDGVSSCIVDVFLFGCFF